MASEQQVKRYLAYWFQLGKQVVIHNGQRTLQPKQVIAGDRYSQDFEDIWQLILSPDSGDCYLEGTEQTVAELLTPDWDVEACARCEKPIPIKTVGMPPDCCPCFTLPSWPNLDLPAPREPICSQKRLSLIRSRLNQLGNRQLPPDDQSPDPWNSDQAAKLVSKNNLTHKHEPHKHLEQDDNSDLPQDEVISDSSSTESSLPQKSDSCQASLHRICDRLHQSQERHPQRQEPSSYAWNGKASTPPELQGQQKPLIETLDHLYKISSPLGPRKDFLSTLPILDLYLLPESTRNPEV
ncbi:MAG TPA: hypothetical protein V6D33_14860 [Cyanophyceae cyanobacterium]